MTPGRQTVRGKHVDGWGGETWHALEDGVGQMVGEMAKCKFVQLVHVKRWVEVVLVVDNEQCVSRPCSVGLYRGGKLGVGPVVADGVEGIGAVVCVAEDAQVEGMVRAMGQGDPVVPVVVGLRGVKDTKDMKDMEDTEHTKDTEIEEDMRNAPVSGSDSCSHRGRAGSRSRLNLPPRMSGDYRVHKM